MRMALRGLLLVSALIVPGLALAQSTSCKPSDIKIDQVKIHGTTPSDGNNHLIGRMVNNCAEPIGAQVKIIYYGKGKEILKVSDVWPASVNNIDAHSDYPFDMVFEPIPGFEHVEMRINRVQRW